MKFSLILVGFWATLSQINGEPNAVLDSLKKPLQNTTDVCTGAFSWTLIPHRQDCHKFYACINHEPEEFSCAKNYYFSETDSRCIQGDCISEEVEISAPAEECKPHAVQRISSNCTLFSVCLNGKYQELQCPVGRYYDATHTSCQRVASDAYHKCSCILPGKAVLANREHCGQYFECSDGQAVLHQCPHGHYYNERISSCLPDLEGICQTTPTVTSALEELQAACQNDDDMNGVSIQPLANDCRKFYLCLGGRVYTKECRKGFYFDRKQSYCRLDAGNECSKQQAQFLVDADKQQNQVEKEVEAIVVALPGIGSGPEIMFTPQLNTDKDVAASKDDQKQQATQKEQQTKPNTNENDVEPLAAVLPGIGSRPIILQVPQKPQKQHNKQPTQLVEQLTAVQPEPIKTDNESNKKEVWAVQQQSQPHRPSKYDKLSSKFLSFQF